jgi:hypothetical protein
MTATAVADVAWQSVSFRCRTVAQRDGMNDSNGPKAVATLAEPDDRFAAIAVLHEMVANVSNRLKAAGRGR